MAPVNSRTCDIAIIGCGPVGATLANLLGRYGLDVIVVERDEAIHQLPRAVHFDGEAMRIFQAAGLASDVAAIARPTSKGMHFVDAAGELLLVRRGHDGPGPHGWASNWYAHQPHLDRVLRAGLARFGTVHLMTGWHATSVVEVAGGATIAAIAKRSGDEMRVTARFIVGCDGARSLVRQVIGSASEDLGLHQPWLVADIVTHDGSPRVAALPDHSVQVCDPDRPMTLVYVGGSRRRWEIMLMPGDDPARMAEPEVVWSFLKRWIGPDDARIERAAVYTFHSVIARGWRKGPLLIAGDACHQTPPFLGQGMCAGLRDAMNLAWKLELIIKRGADPAILGSYESERWPHVEAFIRLAVELGAVIQTRDGMAAARRDRLNAGGLPRMFDFPQPQLGPGLRDEAPQPVGMIVPQPRLADGRLLDDVTGARFVIAGNGGAIDGASPQCWGAWQAVGASFLRHPEPPVAEMIDGLGARVALWRPDGYLLGVADNAADLVRISRILPACHGD